MRTCTYNLVVCLCALAYMAGCGAPVKVTADGKTMRGPVSAIVIHDFTAETGVEVPESIIPRMTSSCLQSLSSDARIKPVPVTRETSNRLPDGAIGVRGHFTGFDRPIYIAPGPSASHTVLQIQISVHDLATGKLLASKEVKRHYAWDKPVLEGDRVRSVGLDQNEYETRLCTTIAKQLKDVVQKYLTTAGRKPMR